MVSLKEKRNHREKLEKLKKNVRAFFEYFQENFKSFHEFRTFVFKSNFTESSKSANEELDRPNIEFNIIEAYLSRLYGEFSKQEPSLKVTPAEGAEVNPQLIEIVEGHVRHIMKECKSNNCGYDIYRDTLSGGFSALKVWTDYANSMSFDQVIKVEKIYDPTLVFFDPLAKESSKIDGSYWGELFPLTEEEFKEQYPNIDVSTVSFTRTFEGFNWSYQINNKKILIICDYYEKQKKKVKIVKLENGEVIFEKDYKTKNWKKDVTFLGKKPKIIGEPRETEINVITRYRLIENKIIEVVETDYQHLNGVFVDGNSIVLKDNDTGRSYQMTRPYAYHAKGIQLFANVAGQNLANEFETLVQHKVTIAQEALPDKYQELKAYTDPQKANVYVYKAFTEDGRPLPPPQPVQRTPIPPELMASFKLADEKMQAILGSYDASLGINNNQLSGLAIVEGATQSNAAAMPYIVNYLKAWEATGKIILSLIPKYYVTPRTIPIIGKNGKRQFVKINDPADPKSVQIKYNPDDLEVEIKAGVNFEIERQRTLKFLMEALSAQGTTLSNFINEKGLPLIIENLDIRGKDYLMQLAEQYMEEQPVKAQEAAQNALQNDPKLIKSKTEQARLLHDMQKSDKQFALDAANLSVKQQLADNASIQMASLVNNNEAKELLEREKIEAEKTRAAVDLVLKGIKGHEELLKLHQEGHVHGKDESERRSQSLIESPAEISQSSKTHAENRETR